MSVLVTGKVFGAEPTIYIEYLLLAFFWHRNYIFWCQKQFRVREKLILIFYIVGVFEIGFYKPKTSQIYPQIYFLPITNNENMFTDLFEDIIIRLLW